MKAEAIGDVINKINGYNKADNWSLNDGTKIKEFYTDKEEAISVCKQLQEENGSYHNFIVTQYYEKGEFKWLILEYQHYNCDEYLGRRIY